ncbi:MAG: hypothetical protein WC641_02130 [Patescibacteria group bacterium]
MIIEDLLKKIKSKGYWKVVIRPNKFIEKLIFPIGECEKIIEKNKIVFRGWDYPHIDIGGIKLAGDNSIHSYCDWPEGPMFEYWRFYQTGQFVHYFAMREDLRIDEEKKKYIQQQCNTKSEKFLDIISTLYSVTEIYEFAARLSRAIPSIEGMQVIIELHDVNSRMLFFWNSSSRMLNSSYVCEYPGGVLTTERVISRDDLDKNAAVLALDVTVEILNKFNWERVDRSIFVDDQRELLNRGAL